MCVISMYKRLSWTGVVTNCVGDKKGFSQYQFCDFNVCVSQEYILDKDGR